MAKSIRIKTDRIYGDISAVMTGDDGDKIEITTGAGGDGQRLRYYFVVSSIKKVLDVGHKKLILQVFKNIAKKFDLKIEYTDFGLNHFLISVLVPWTVAVGELIEQGIKAINKKQNILRFHYLVVNTHKPNNEEISQYLAVLR